MALLTAPVFIEVAVPIKASSLPIAATLYAEKVKLSAFSAGNPILAEAHVEAQCRVDPRLFRQRANYLLRVVGASMQDVGILDGDLLAIHQTQEARDGQIVIARVDNEVTVKRYKRSGHTAYLQPENRAFKTIEIDLRRESLAIEGVVVGVVRTL